MTRTMTAKIQRTMLVSTAALCVPSLAYGQLFSEDFEVDPTANWWINSHPGGTDDATDFFFDYSTIGIPSAPKSGGTTRGMKLQANLFSSIFGGYSVSPADLELTGDYALSFDVWSNYVGPLEFGGSGSTNLSTYGIMCFEFSSNYPGAADGVWFGTTGDGGSSADWRIYSPDAVAGYPSGHAFFADPSRNHTGATYQFAGGYEAPAAQIALFPQQTGFTRFGTAGFAWHEVVIEKSGDIVTWTMDGVLLATVDTFGMVFGGGSILFGHSDINSGSSSDPNAPDLLFTLVDNISVDTDSCYADCDKSTGNGVLDIFDFLCFQDSFVAGGAYACECDTSTGVGVCDIFDFLCFQDAFVAGCP